MALTDPWPTLTWETNAVPPLSPFFYYLSLFSRLSVHLRNVIERRDARWSRNEIHRSHSNRMKNCVLKLWFVLSAKWNRGIIRSLKAIFGIFPVILRIDILLDWKKNDDTKVQVNDLSTFYSYNCDIILSIEKHKRLRDIFFVSVFVCRPSIRSLMVNHSPNDFKLRSLDTVYIHRHQNIPRYIIVPYNNIKYDQVRLSAWPCFNNKITYLTH